MKTFLIPFSSSSHSATIEVIFNIIKKTWRKDFHTVKTQWREKVRIDGKQFHYNRTCWIFFSFISHNMKKKQQLQVFHPLHSLHFLIFSIFLLHEKQKKISLQIEFIAVYRVLVNLMNAKEGCKNQLWMKLKLQFHENCSSTSIRIFSQNNK